MRRFLFNASLFVYYLLGFVGLVIHGWSIMIVYSYYGYMRALLALCLPFVTQIYLTFMSYSVSGAFINKYTIVLFTYLISIAVVKVFAAFMAPTTDY